MLLLKANMKDCDISKLNTESRKERDRIIAKIESLIKAHTVPAYDTRAEIEVLQSKAAALTKQNRETYASSQRAYVSCQESYAKIQNALADARATIKEIRENLRESSERIYHVNYKGIVKAKSPPLLAFFNY